VKRYVDDISSDESEEEKIEKPKININAILKRKPSIHNEINKQVRK